LNQTAAAILAEQRQENRVRVGLFDIGSINCGVVIDFLSEVCVAPGLLPLVSSRPEVLGSLELRGSIVPVVDMSRLFGGPAREGTVELVAIVQFEGRRIGLAIDRIRGVASYSETSANELYATGSRSVPFVRRGVLDGGSVINLIEVPRIFQEPDLPTVSTGAPGGAGSGDRGRVAYLTFEVGDATFGIEATMVFGTVPRQTIDPGPVAGSRCLGLIRYLHRDVPVVDCAELVGLGAAASAAQPEVVVIRLQDERVVGLAVDLIRRIEFVDRATIKASPRHVLNSAALATAFFLAGDDTPVFILEAGDIEGVADVRSISDLSRLAGPAPEGSTGHPQDASPAGTGAPDGKMGRCLVYAAGRRQASVLTEVVSILEPPERVTPVRDAHPSVRGVFVHHGNSVLLVDLARSMRGSDAGAPSGERVLLVDGENGLVGFLVESVDAIETTRTVISEPGDPMGPVAYIGQGKTQYTLPFVNLTDLATRLSAPQ